MRFLFRVCQFFVGLGLLGLVIATADQIFGLGMFPNGYPAGQVDSQGHQIGSSYWVYMRNVGIIVGVALLLGTFLASRLRRREVAALLFLQEVEEADAPTQEGSEEWWHGDEREPEPRQDLNE